MQKHHDELFPPVQEPNANVIAQAALFFVIREQRNAILPNALSTPWDSLTSRRFGGDTFKRTIKLQTEDSKHEISAHIVQKAPGIYDAIIETSQGLAHFLSVPAHLKDKNTLSVVLDNNSLQTTIVAQPPHPAVPASQSANTMERLHIFSEGQRTTLVVPSPAWLLSLGGDLLSAHKGALKVPMPSLIVELRVKVGDRVEKGQAIVVIESMKTETVLRADSSGTVKAVGCKTGEMVEEGRELVEIEADE